MKKKNAWDKYTGTKREDIFSFAEEYKTFISENKTERECVSDLVDKAQAAGFIELSTLIDQGKEITSGDKIYVNNMGKALALFVIGTRPLEEGMNILGAHIDSPRIDIKQNPLYEETGMVLLDTHYYGGIKKYQWVTLPLALHGVVVKKDGTIISINIGEKENDPVFCITDLLVHLASEQLLKKANKVIEGEGLDVLFGNIPFTYPSEAEKKKAKDIVKANIIHILEQEYQIDEEDFISAEIELVPAGKARDLGLDKSMIIGYGQDDRVCAYTSFRAILEAGTCDKTSVCLLVDKEEVGSCGATGMQSKFFEYSIVEIMERMQNDASSIHPLLRFQRAMSNSHALSSDVSAAYDPLYASVMDKKNAAYLGKGIVFNKYTGSRGKSGSNDANPEYVAKLRQIMDQHDIYFHTAELGKVDAGGGGTIAYIFANYNMQVIDSGVAVLSMHSPWEVVSKVDVYEAKLAYMAFLKEIK
jgi:aspartyl aminopeptidase